MSNQFNFRVARQPHGSHATPVWKKGIQSHLAMTQIKGRQALPVPTLNLSHQAYSRINLVTY